MSNNRNRRRKGRAANVAVATGGRKPYTFTHNGRTYRLPDAQAAMQKVPAGALIDAATGDANSAELQLGLAIIKAASADIDPDAMQALRQKNIYEFGAIIGGWMQSAGVDAGESASSSS